MEMFKRVYCKLAQYSYERMGRLLKPRGRVLMFHSVGDIVEDEFNVSVNELESVLSSLAHKNVIPLESWETEDDFYALTFDDVPDSFYKYAYPLLKKYNLPFTIFVSTSLVGKEGYLNWEQILEISKSKLCSIGSHGHKHDFFWRMTSSEARNDLSESKQLLEKKVNISMDKHLFDITYILVLLYNWR